MGEVTVRSTVRWGVVLQMVLIYTKQIGGNFGFLSGSKKRWLFPRVTREINFHIPRKTVRESTNHKMKKKRSRHNTFARRTVMMVSRSLRDLESPADEKETTQQTSCQEQTTDDNQLPSPNDPTPNDEWEQEMMNDDHCDDAECIFTDEQCTGKNKIYVFQVSQTSTLNGHSPLLS